MSKNRTPLQKQIDRERGLYNYYKKKSDLLSKCKMEVHKSNLERLKKESAIISYNAKIERFFDQYPEYKDVL